MSRDFPTVCAVCLSQTHTFHKLTCTFINLLAGLGVEGDAHAGVTVKHRSRVKIDPARPNLRQVHLIHQELLDGLNQREFRVQPGDLGENITTKGIDLLALPAGARLRIGASAVVEVTGLRNPCRQLDEFQNGLMEAVLDRTPGGELVRKAGIMGIVVAGGTVRPGDAIEVTLPGYPHQKLGPV
ncbi:MAG: MOSC domain-containing protein [Proteobacteria bacterium]|nr:MOSC domain-containing protein [Pseudomonadota bacterium]